VDEAGPVAEAASCGFNAGFDDRLGVGDRTTGGDTPKTAGLGGGVDGLGFAFAGLTVSLIDGFSTNGFSAGFF
jgi:hypothetical protein